METQYTKEKVVKGSIHFDVLHVDNLGIKCSISGPVSTIEWAHPQPQCDFTLVRDEHGDYSVTVFGGSVWPGAWPEIFTPPPDNNYTFGSNKLTMHGKQLLSEAIISFIKKDVVWNSNRVNTLDTEFHKSQS